MPQNNLKDLKTRLTQCNLESPEVRDLMRGHVLTEKERLGASLDSLGGCLDAAAILIDSAGQMRGSEAAEIQNLLLQLVDVVSEASERRAAPARHEKGATPSGINVLNHMALGQVMVQLGFVGPEVVDEALREATRSQRPIGQVMIEMGAVTAEDLENAYTLQKTLTTHGTAPGSARSTPTHPVHRVLLGETLVSLAMIDRSQLNQGLRLQKRKGQRLGEALVELGFLDQAQLRRAIELQARQSASL